MAELAERLSERFGGAQAFFCNSGAEAIEAALKYARKATGKPGVVALEGSFHGRTLGALSVTGQPAKRAAFEPLLRRGRVRASERRRVARAAVDAETGCILLEPVLGEGGVNPLEPAFVEAARALADELGALLGLDEVQTGVGRTGTFFAFEQLGVRPDAVTLAKGLANGLPIGCLLVADAAPARSCPATTRSPSAATPSRARRRAQSATRSTTSCCARRGARRRARAGLGGSAPSGVARPRAAARRGARPAGGERRGAPAWSAGCSSARPASACCG